MGSGRSLQVSGLMMLSIVWQAASYAGPGKYAVRPVWVADNGDGTYRNPILFADYSDPDVIRVGGDFYLVSSSFNCVPGIPLLHSRDLVNWTIIGHVLPRIPFEAFDTPQHGNGVWAPAIRFREGYFYVYYPDPDRGIFVCRTKNPMGTWEAPVCVSQAKGAIDPCPFWDDDGSAYLVYAWARSRAGINSILTLARMSEDGMKVLDEGKMAFDGRTNHPTIEGPKMYKRNEYYYIFAPAGGVTQGWQTVLRSKNIYGPYEDRIVLAQGKTEINGPHQGAWVELESGESWFVHFQDRGAYGRVVHLQPMRWVDDWPVIGNDEDGDAKGEPVLVFKKPNVGKTYPAEVPQTSDEFDTNRRGLAWQWHANPKDDWMSLNGRRGWLRLFAVPGPADSNNLWTTPNLLLQKLPAPEFTMTTKLDFSKLALGERTGLIVMGRDYSYLAAERTTSGCMLMKMSCRNASDKTSEAEEGRAGCASEVMYLRVKVGQNAICEFSYSVDGQKFTPIGKPFTARAGGWIGAKVGLFCLGRGRRDGQGCADYDWFRVE